MNEISSNYCFRDEIHISFLTYTQLVTVSIFNELVMVGNVIGNTLVIYVLIKTKHLSNVACKLIFMLSVSDLMVGAFGQNLFFAMLFGTKCSVKLSSRVLSVFFTSLSGYTIAIIGVDRFARIKYRTNFSTKLTNRFMLALMSMACFRALISAVGTPIGLLLRKERIFTSISFGLSVIVLSIVTFLQVLVIQTSNAVFDESSVHASQTTNKNINKLSMRIMLLFAFFYTPYLAVSFARAALQKRLNRNEKSTLEFILRLASISSYTNSMIDAILFLIMNVKARRYLRDFAK